MHKQKLYKKQDFKKWLYLRNLKYSGLKRDIKTAFDSDLPVTGSWGYTKDDVTIIEASNMPLKQIEHIFASMRAYVEMNMTLQEGERYGSINLNEKTREELIIDIRTIIKYL